jgi:death-on-curing protein
MAIYLTVAEVYQQQYQLIERFGRLHGVRDKNAVEAAVFRPQTGYYGSIEEEAAALMESLANNHGFVDGNKRVAFAGAATFLLLNGYELKVSAGEGYAFIYGSLDRGEFRFSKILMWVRKHARSLSQSLQ